MGCEREQWRVCTDEVQRSHSHLPALLCLRLSFCSLLLLRFRLPLGFAPFQSDINFPHTPILAIMSDSASTPPASPAPKFGRIEFANLPFSLLIFFGMWVCWEAGQGGPMPHPLLEPFKTVGLYIFQKEWVLGYVFWLAVYAHLFEGALALRFAFKVRGFDLPFLLFWTLQTAAVGFPSLKLIKEQRRQQVKAKGKAAREGGGKKGQ